MGEGWGGGVKSKEDDSDWKFETGKMIGNYRGINLANVMLLCESISSENKDK